ncbi:hypothetical protein R5R35_008133 [Gryllus longicercus]|uniref:E3 ubiquitin-protein ligase RNF25 n=1 Tax=Gryllus longicercus TaxID=2509291 RepID=A0AAN9VG60_9ORTH
MSSITSDVDERIVDEVEALKAIMMDEVIVKCDENGFPSSVETVVFPATADDAMRKYVCVTLVVELPEGYPDKTPNVMLRNPRGLDDTVLEKIQVDIKEKCSDYTGQPVIYELIELVKEHLTASNLPSCQCAICLYGFSEGDQFTKTECYHYFHSYCLASHVVNTEKSFKEEQEKLPAWQRVQKTFQVQCPVCREPIAYDMDLLTSAPPPLDVENARQFELNDELRSLQQKMASLFSYQKSRGGIIDPEADDSKLVLVTNTPTEEAPAGPSLPPPPPVPKTDKPPTSSEGYGFRGEWRRGRSTFGRGRGGFRGRKSSGGSARGRQFQPAVSR